MSIVLSYFLVFSRDRYVDNKPLTLEITFTDARKIKRKYSMAVKISEAYVSEKYSKTNAMFYSGIFLRVTYALC